jgi:hypothetical protein
VCASFKIMNLLLGYTDLSRRIQLLNSAYPLTSIRFIVYHMVSKRQINLLSPLKPACALSQIRKSARLLPLANAKQESKVKLNRLSQTRAAVTYLSQHLFNHTHFAPVNRPTKRPCSSLLTILPSVSAKTPVSWTIMSLVAFILH